MRRGQPIRFWIETILATLSGALTIITLISREWIEFLFGVDPDSGSGTLEWGIVLLLLVIALVFGTLARATHRRYRLAAR